MFEDIDKIAQRRNLFQKFKEKVNVPRALKEKILSESYGSQLEQLREVDDNVRDLALNGTAANSQGLKADLKDAKQALKDRRYLDVVHYVGNINNKIGLMAHKIDVLKLKRDDNIDDFYGQSESFKSDRDYFQIAEQKTAGIFDYFSDRARAARHLEKVYKNKLKKRYNDMQKLVNKTDILINSTINSLKEMGDHRASGNISDYIKASNKIEEVRKSFHAEFKTIYDTHVKDMVARMKQKTDEATAAKAEEDAVEVERAREQARVKEEEAARVEEEERISTEEMLPQLEVSEEREESDEERQRWLGMEQEQPPEFAESVVPEELIENEEKAAYLIMNIVKEGKAQGRSKEFMANMFMDYAGDLMKAGCTRRSKQCIAVADGLLNGW